MTQNATDISTPDSGAATVKVWDIFVRVSHWTVAVAFFIAYFTEDDILTLHVWAGYTIGVFVVLRIVWGFVGPKHARFSDFMYRPFKVWQYLLELISFRAKRYLGHSPAGGAMTFALLIGLAATVWTGLELYAAEENAGPLASISRQITPVVHQEATMITYARADDGNDRDEKHGKDAGGIWEDLHELLANLMLTLVIIHIGGVLLASIVHRENLARAMVTGRKRAE